MRKELLTRAHKDAKECPLLHLLCPLHRRENALLLNTTSRGWAVFVKTYSPYKPWTVVTDMPPPAPSSSRPTLPLPPSFLPSPYQTHHPR
jgi:hypothetical protein